MEAAFIYGTIDLVSGYLNKSLYLMSLGAFQKYLGALDIGLNERRGIQDAPVNMGLSGEIDNGVKALVQNSIHRLAVSNIDLHEVISWSVLNIFQVLQVSGVGQLIQVRYFPLRMLFSNVMDEITADEARASSYKQSHCTSSGYLCGG